MSQCLKSKLPDCPFAQDHYRLLPKTQKLNVATTFCEAMICALFLCWAADLPRGALPGAWDRYRKAIDRESGTFTCFDGSKVILLSQVNDEDLDCPDGSDEPGTSVSPGGKFYCQNNGSQAVVISSWSVGDGVCDCCDGSDEVGNRRVSCPDRCEELELERRATMGFVRSVYEEGLLLKEKMTAKGAKTLKRLQRDIQRAKKERKELKKEKEAALNDANGQDEDPEMYEEEFQYEEMDYVKEVFYRIWKWTFRVPKKRIRDYYDSYGSLGYEGQQKVHELDTKIYDMKQNITRARKLLEMTELDPAILSLYGQTFVAGPHEMEFLVAVTRNGEVLGNFESCDNDTMNYDQGSYCWEAQASRKCTVSLVCANATALIDVTEQPTCEYHAVFTTPAACTKQRIADLESMQASELAELAELMKKAGSSSEPPGDVKKDEL